MCIYMVLVHALAPSPVVANCLYIVGGSFELPRLRLNDNSPD